MRNVWLGLGIVAVALVGACSLLLPDGFVVRGPILSSLMGRGIDAPSDGTVRGRFHAPEGFRVDLYAEGLPGIRFMRMSPEGALLASQPRSGRIVHVLGDANGDGRSDGHRELLDYSLSSPW